MDPEQEIDNTDRRRKIILWLVVGLVIVGIIAGSTLLLRRSQPSGAEEPVITVATLSASLDALSARITTLETRIATQAESIADLESAAPTDWTSAINEIRNDITALEARPEYSAAMVDFEGRIAASETAIADLESVVPPSCNCTDWTSAINEIGSDIMALETSLAAIIIPDYSASMVDFEARIAMLEAAIAALPTTAFSYPSVTKVENNYVDVTLPEAGEYAVVVSLFGDGLIAADVEARYSSYAVTDMWASNTTLFAVIEPVDSWEISDIIELKVTAGDVAYASAAIAKGSVASGPGW